jgi:hypothetical protein
MIHILKTHPTEFEAVRMGRKTHEIRKLDGQEAYRVGDKLHLREWDPDKNGGQYTGRECIVGVTHVTPGGAWQIPSDVCVMSIKLMAESSPTEEGLLGTLEKIVGGFERIAG